MAIWKSKGDISDCSTYSTSMPLDEDLRGVLDSQLRNTESMLLCQGMEFHPSYTPIDGKKTAHKAFLEQGRSLIEYLTTLSGEFFSAMEFRKHMLARYNFCTAKS